MKKQLFGLFFAVAAYSVAMMSCSKHEEELIIHPDAFADTFSLYVNPNPFYETFYLSISHDVYGLFHVEILNTNGESVYKQDHQLQYPGQFLYFDLGHLPDGIYFMNVKRGAYTATVRLVKT